MSSPVECRAGGRRGKGVHEEPISVAMTNLELEASCFRRS